MLDSQKPNVYPLYYILFYFLYYMAAGAFGTYLPIYFMQIGFNQASIGTLLALGPFVAILAQPVWGVACDRSKTKNIVLLILLTGSTLVVLFYRLNSSFVYLCIVMAVFTFFSTPIMSIMDAITLEGLEGSGWKFGPVRMAGTVGCSIIVLVTGFIAKQDVNVIFLMYFVITTAAILIFLKIPKIKGHQAQGNRVPMKVLFKNREYVSLLVLGFVFSITLGFNNTFFAIYYKQLGADNSMVGVATFITAVAEIPFLLIAHKALDKLGTKRAMLGSFFLASVRWLLMYLVTDIHSILFISSIHGVNFIVFSYAFVIYINNNIPKEFRATGQTIYGLVSAGAARIIAGLLGGILAQGIGIRQVYLYNSLLAFIVILIFTILFYKSGRKNNVAVLERP